MTVRDPRLVVKEHRGRRTAPRIASLPGNFRDRRLPEVLREEVVGLLVQLGNHLPHGDGYMAVDQLGVLGGYSDGGLSLHHDTLRDQRLAERPGGQERRLRHTDSVAVQTTA